MIVKNIAAFKPQYFAYPHTRQSGQFIGGTQKQVIIPYRFASILSPVQSRQILSANIKDRRKKLGISQEKLAEMSELPVQMVNSIEGHRAWVSDKTLIALSDALGIEVFRLFTPGIEGRKQEHRPLPSHWLLKLRQDIKADISADVDMHFQRLFSMNLQE